MKEDYVARLDQVLRQYKKFSQIELRKRGYDLSEEQLGVLSSVYQKSGLSQKEIARVSGKDPASVTRMLDLLEKKDLLKRKASEYDRRSTAVHLTKKGMDFMEEVQPIMLELREFGIRKVSADDVRTFLNVLKRIEKNME